MTCRCGWLSGQQSDVCGTVSPRWMAGSLLSKPECSTRHASLDIVLVFYFCLLYAFLFISMSTSSSCATPTSMSVIWDGMFYIERISSHFQWTVINSLVERLRQRAKAELGWAFEFWLYFTSCSFQSDRVSVLLYQKSFQCSLKWIQISQSKMCRIVQL